MNTSPIAPTLNFEDVAKILGVCTKTVRKLRKTGKISFVLVSDKRIRFRPSDIEEFLDSNSQRQTGVNTHSTKNQIRHAGATISSAKIVTFTDLQTRKQKQEALKSEHGFRTEDRAMVKVPGAKP